MLEQYRAKRDFKITPEPPPDAQKSAEGPLIFIVQKHAASQLHYDFRLEIDGALKSWPVPRGPSLNPQDKRLAVMTEDHPLGYATFEGVIPKGEYGAGQVIVWDAGTYSPDEDGKLSFADRAEAEQRMREGLAKGKLSVLLRGHKLKGSWTLVKTKRGENEWLMIKHKDRFADAERDILEEDRSVLSDLTIQDLKAGRLPDRGEYPTLGVRPSELPGARAGSIPDSISPMQAELAENSFTAPGWLFEPKLDGVRAIAVIDHGSVRLFSRSGLETTRQFPSLAAEVAKQPEPQLILDGEIVAMNEDGVPAFQSIQPRLNLTRDADIRRMDAQIPVFYYVFDILYATGYDLRNVPLHLRKVLLAQLVLPDDRVSLVSHFGEYGEDAYLAALEVGMEGVVAKRDDSLYESGRRSRSWLKIKRTREDDFVVAGFTEGSGNRSKTFGALILGQYAGKRLEYAGHVGTGFDDKTLDQLRAQLDGIKTEKQPFPSVPQLNAPATWVKPELVARVKFTERTHDGLPRAPSFQGLRQDKAAAEARRENPVAAPAPPSASPSADPDTAEVIEQLGSSSDRLTLTLDGNKIALSNLDKEMWPSLGDQRALTKRDLLLDLARASRFILPHMRDRPITLTRYPNGIGGQHFYQKNWDSKMPAFVETVRLYSGHNEGDVEYLICNNLATLLWLGQLADIELHTWYSRVSPEPDGHHLSTTFTGSEENIDESLLNYPDFIVFDLDPYIYSGKEKQGDEPALNRKAFAKTCDVAFWLKDALDSLSLSSFVKTTGRTGLHIYVPILRQLDYDAVRAACGALGKIILAAHPRDVTMEWSVDKRTGKVFFDHNQNSRGKTLASVYSPRPSPEAAVSVPVRWAELRDIYPTDFTILTTPDRLAEVGDLWSDILAAKHDLDALLKAAD